MSNKTKAIAAILLTSIFGGAVSTIIKIAVVSIPPFNFSFIRFLIASLCLLPLFIQRKPKFDKSLIKLILLSLLATLNIAFFVIGIKTTTASSAQLLYAGVPLLAGLIGYILFRNKLTFNRTLSITIGLVGVFFVIFWPLIQKNSPNVGSFSGNITVFLAVISWSCYAVLSKQFQKKYSPIILTSMFCFTATFVFFLLSILELDLNNYWWTNLSPKAVVGLLYVSVIGTVGTYLLNQYAFKYADAVLGSLNLYLMPIIAYFTAFLLLGEKLNFGLIIGTLLIFLSVALTSYSK